jgi:nicotinamidase-related amidase
MNPVILASTALLLIDLQQAFQEIEALGLKRNNPNAMTRIGEVLAYFRARNGHVIHVRHASREAESRFRPEQSGYAPLAATCEVEGELVLVKHVNSAFIGTDLQARLVERGIDTLVIAGATTNHCVETTTRMAGNLGFRALLVEDACWTFDRKGPDATLHLAADIHRMSLANLNEEFAEITTASALLEHVCF